MDVTATSVATNIVNLQANVGSYETLVFTNVNNEAVCEISKSDILNDCSDTMASPGANTYTIKGEKAGQESVVGVLTVTNINRNCEFFVLEKNR